MLVLVINSNYKYLLKLYNVRHVYVVYRLGHEIINNTMACTFNFSNRLVYINNLLFKRIKRLYFEYGLYFFSTIAVLIYYYYLIKVPEIDSVSPKGIRPENFVGNIEFRNVVFRYPSRPSVTVIKEFVKFL